MRLLPVRIFQMIRVRPPAFEFPAKVSSIDFCVRVLKWLDHAPENLKQILRLRGRRYLRAKFPVDGLPVQMPQAEEGIVLGEGLPEDGIVLLGSIRRKLSAWFRPGIFRAP